MKIILASGNRGKIEEIKNILDYEVVPYFEIIEKFEIEENGSSFKENAIIKAKAIYEKLDKDSIVLADDSGISVPVLGGIPGIYSARFAGENATDKDNLDKLISILKEKKIKKTYAFYTASIAVASKWGVFTSHGFMRGDVIDEKRGDKGFGYDPMFIPYGYNKTLGELEEDIKRKISHRVKALENIKPLLKLF